MHKLNWIKCEFIKKKTSQVENLVGCEIIYRYVASNIMSFQLLFYLLMFIEAYEPPNKNACLG